MLLERQQWQPLADYSQPIHFCVCVLMSPVRATLPPIRIVCSRRQPLFPSAHHLPPTRSFSRPSGNPRTSFFTLFRPLLTFFHHQSCTDVISPHFFSAPSFHSYLSVLNRSLLHLFHLSLLLFLLCFFFPVFHPRFTLSPHVSFFFHLPPFVVVSAVCLFVCLCVNVQVEPVLSAALLSRAPVRVVLLVHQECRRRNTSGNGGHWSERKKRKERKK